MKKIFKSIIFVILSIAIFGLVFSSSIEFSIDHIFEAIYDYASPESRGNVVQELNEVCKNVDLIIENPEILETGDAEIDVDKLIELCKKNLQERELFIGLLKLQTGGVEDVGGNLGKYLMVFGQGSKVSIIYIVVIIVFTALLFISSKDNPVEFLKTVAQLLLKVGVVLVIMYLLPKIILYFVKPDTSFILEVDPESGKVPGTQEILLNIIPIILGKMFTEKILIYGGIMVLISGITLIVLRIRNKSTK